MSWNDTITDYALSGFSVSPAERLAVVLRHSQETSLHSLARALRLRRSENLYQIKRGNNNISVPLARRITEVYPQFNVGWLITGMGEPFCEPSSLTVSPSVKKLPLHTVLDLLPDGTLRETERILTFPSDFCPSAELVTVCHDDAIEPRAMPGDYLFLAPSTVETVVFGRLYLIVTASARLCRMIRKGENEGRLRLVSLKPERYDDIVLSKERIRALYRICGTFQYWDG